MWRSLNADNAVPEAFFRACRTLSQEGLAQFIFTGERTIAMKLWDAHSPHWNFCRPLPLQQLTRTAAADLLTRPLESLGIEIVDRNEFEVALWRYTSGHPQLVQYLGDRLVRLLNERRPDRRTIVDPPDLRRTAVRHQDRNSIEAIRVIGITMLRQPISRDAHELALLGRCDIVFGIGVAVTAALVVRSFTV